MKPNKKAAHTRMIKKVRMMGRISTPKKAKAARRNGLKGGRPRKWIKCGQCRKKIPVHSTSCSKCNATDIEHET